MQPEEGSLFAEVQDASSDDERRDLLQSEGFERSSGQNGEERYAKTVDGVTLGWEIGPEQGEGAVSPMWNVGWDGGAYVAATTEQWQNLGVNAGAVGTAACTFITLTWGAAGCVAAAGILAAVALAQKWAHFAWLPTLGFAVACAGFVAEQATLSTLGFFMFAVLTVWHGHQKEQKGRLRPRKAAA